MSNADNSPPAVEVHNAWTIYGKDEYGDRVEEPIAEHSRPQDWGDPRWVYHLFVFTWQTAPDGVPYTNHCHCWTDLKFEDEPGQYAQLFAGLVATILMPGTPRQLCGRSHLAPEDFWDKAWGNKPRTYDPQY